MDMSQLLPLKLSLIDMMKMTAHAAHFCHNAFVELPIAMLLISSARMHTVLVSDSAPPTDVNSRCTIEPHRACTSSTAPRAALHVDPEAGTS